MTKKKSRNKTQMTQHRSMSEIDPLNFRNLQLQKRELEDKVTPLLNAEIGASTRLPIIYLFDEGGLSDGSDSLQVDQNEEEVQKISRVQYDIDSSMNSPNGCRILDKLV